MVYVENIAKVDVTGVVAACNSVRGGEWADDGYTLGQQSEVNDISLGMLSLASSGGRVEESIAYVCNDIVGFYYARGK